MEDMFNADENLSRMQAIFAEREKQYTEREADFKRRRESFAALEEKLTSLKADVEEREKKVAEKEKALEQQIAEKEAAYKIKDAELDEREKRVISLEEQLKQDKTAFENEKSGAYLKVKLEEEQLKNERLKVKREAEALEYEKEMGNIGVEVLREDLSNYIPKSEVHTHYLLRSEVEENYIPRSEHEKKVEELEQSVAALQQAKTELFRKMFGRGGDNADNMDATNTNREQTLDSKSEKKDDLPEKEDALEKPEVRETTEATRDLTVEYLKEYLIDQIDFKTPQVRHAEDGDLLESSIGKLKCYFVFSEPPYFDLTYSTKGGRRLEQHLEQMKGKYSDISFVYENGELRATGFFLRNMSADTLIEEVKKIASDMEEGLRGR